MRADAGCELGGRMADLAEVHATSSSAAHGGQVDALARYAVLWTLKP